LEKVNAKAGKDNQAEKIGKILGGISRDKTYSQIYHILRYEYDLEYLGKKPGK
jgi:hypothetical protein